jgi:hypothetical protein
MTLDSQKFMALFGIKMWANATIEQIKRMETARQSHTSLDAEEREKSILAFNSERHLFLIAANKISEYIEWAINLGSVNKGTFPKLERLHEEIKILRDMNEHVVEYFLGSGNKKNQWLHIDEGSIADASSTVGTKIGGRLDWNEVADAAREVLANVPSPYPQN